MAAFGTTCRGRVHEEGLERACAGWGDELSIVLRDVDVTPAGSPTYVRQTC